MFDVVGESEKRDRRLSNLVVRENLYFAPDHDWSPRLRKRSSPLISGHAVTRAHFESSIKQKCLFHDRVVLLFDSFLTVLKTSSD